MRPSRVPTGLIPVTLLTLAMILAACGGASPAASTGDGGTQQSTAAEPSTNGGDGGNGGNGGDGSDAAGAEELADSLAPSNASETSRSTAGGVVLITWESTDSLESMTDFYEQAIADAGLNVIGTFTTDDGASWTFESGNFSGSVTLIVSSVNSGGTNVSVSVLDISI